MWGQLRAAITPSSAHTTSNRLFLGAYHRFGVTYFIRSIGAFLSVPVAAIIIIVAILSVLGSSSAHLIRYSEWLYLWHQMSQEHNICAALKSECSMTKLRYCLAPLLRASCLSESHLPYDLPHTTQTFVTRKARITPLITYSDDGKGVRITQYMGCYASSTV